MPQKPPTSEKNAGARAERKAFLAYFNRELASYRQTAGSEGEINAFKNAIIWLKSRARRTAKMHGGIGRK